jgi:Fe-S cluster biogenesis protein NfuA
MSRAKKRTVVKKHGGDDIYSWAVIDRKTGHVYVGGCARGEAKSYQSQIEKRLAERAQESAK